MLNVIMIIGTISMLIFAVNTRATLLLNNVLFVIGGVMCAATVSSTYLYVGRFIGGTAVG